MVLDKCILSCLDVLLNSLFEGFYAIIFLLIIRQFMDDVPEWELTMFLEKQVIAYNVLLLNRHIISLELG